MSKTQKLFCDSTQNIMTLANEDISKKQDSMQTCGKESDEALEIQQIELKQHSIIQRLIHLELQKERLKGLLNALHSLDSDDDDRVEEDDDRIEHDDDRIEDDDDDRIEDDDDSSIPMR
ncbi:unnamed protein product [Rotaria magnacalcarata]|uniref:Uncharacterized protein n=1 Tax=Rotaria magnacalcarata TaxID=392030 RepID=A0A816UMG9_9BILA|nr:unnamed protein product [Rotaria magnacalcarata]CAF2199127.1 unnamed protein product [Rotaria magnacalcarata]CAF4152284.1 unnamed protein product [Rotaria magnacalcarata]CAF4194746.1 unnamed protein product [Rotaria magnacalcarata]